MDTLIKEHDEQTVNTALQSEEQNGSSFQTVDETQKIEFITDGTDAEDKTKKVFEGSFDYEKKFPKECYEDYITSFEPNTKKRYFYRFMKRAFDIFASALMLILLSPVFLILAIAIKCDSKGPIIFRQKRIGKGNKPFNCLKFRSMRIDTPRDCATSLLDHPDQYAPYLRKLVK